MFPVIKRFMFSTRRAVWLCQEPNLMFVITRTLTNIWHKTQYSNGFYSLYMIVKCHNKCVISPIDVHSVHLCQGTEGTYLNAHGDGYKSNNQLYDECCLSASPSSVLSYGSLRGSTGGVVHTAVSVKYCDHTTLNLCPLRFIKKKRNRISEEIYWWMHYSFCGGKIHINCF